METINEKIVYYKLKLDKKAELAGTLKKLSNDCSAMNAELNILTVEIDNIQKKLQYTERPEIAFFRRRFTKTNPAEQDSLKEQYYQCVKVFNTKKALVKDQEELCGELHEEIIGMASYEEEMKLILHEKRKEIMSTNNIHSVHISELDELSSSLSNKTEQLNQRKLKLFRLLNPVRLLKSLLTDIIDKGRIEFSGSGNSNSSKKLAAIDQLQSMVEELMDDLQTVGDLEKDNGLSTSNIKAYAMSIQNFSKLFEVNDVFDMAVRRKLAESYDSTIQIFNEIQNLKLFIEDEEEGLQEQLNTQKDHTLKYILDLVLEQENLPK